MEKAVLESSHAAILSKRTDPHMAHLVEVRFENKHELAKATDGYDEACERIA